MNEIQVKLLKNRGKELMIKLWKFLSCHVWKYKKMEKCSQFIKKETSKIVRTELLRDNSFKHTI